MTRKVADCSKTPNDFGCTLVIIGEEDEVIRCAVQHASSVHGEPDTAETRGWIRDSLENEDTWLTRHSHISA